MEIEFKSNDISRKKIILDETLETRINETVKNIIFRIRNISFETTGRKLIFDDVEKITEVLMGDMLYSNLEYISSETYFHNIKAEGTETIKMVEDFVITFLKREVI